MREMLTRMIQIVVCLVTSIIEVSRGQYVIAAVLLITCTSAGYDLFNWLFPLYEKEITRRNG